MRKVFTREAIEEGVRIPRWYGIAWRDYCMNTKVCYPIPLNLIFRWARNFWFWLMSAGRPGYRERMEKRLHEKYRQLLIDKYNEGVSRGWEDAMVKVIVSEVRFKEDDE